MKLVNCSLDECNSFFDGRKIIFFGCGSWLQIVNHTAIMQYSSNFLFVIDNGDLQNTRIGNISLEVKKPAVVDGMKSIAIVLTSPVYMYDMYKQLREYDLDDSCICMSFPFMQMISNTSVNSECLSAVRGMTEAKIPKVIHSFWFGKDEKSELYQRCIDSWKEILTDYKIIEWNQDNYDCMAHPFVRKAIEEKAWAFASDYARLDVLYRYGGIYLDMDVEVFKTFDDLLGNDAILSFSNNVQIDLAVVGSKQGNPLLAKLRSLYDGVILPEKREDFSKFFQPSFVRETLHDYGIRMDGSLQVLQNCAVFPKEFFMPQDHILFAQFDKTENTYCVHYDNFGWSFSKDSKREKKIRENNLLWNEVNAANEEN